MEETEKLPQEAAGNVTENRMKKGCPHAQGHHGHHHGHGHHYGHGSCCMKKLPADSLMGLMYAFGHRFHHTKEPEMTEEHFFGALDAAEKEQLQALLTKAKAGWTKPGEKPAE